MSNLLANLADKLFGKCFLPIIGLLTVGWVTCFVVAGINPYPFQQNEWIRGIVEKVRIVPAGVSDLSVASGALFGNALGGTPGAVVGAVIGSEENDYICECVVQLPDGNHLSFTLAGPGTAKRHCSNLKNGGRVAINKRTERNNEIIYSFKATGIDGIILK